MSPTTRTRGSRGGSSEARSAEGDPSGFDAHGYMDAVAAALQLPIPFERRDAVAANLARLHALAQDLLDWQPPADAAGESDPP